jgi:ABC-type transport system involved in cytochrome bd biosynthesis fused ATPase/permease subunit
MVAVVGVRAFALARASFRYLQRLALHDAVFRRLTEIRPLIFRKLVEFAPGGIPSRGKALETFTADVEKLQDWPLRVLAPILQAAAAVLTMFAISLWIFPLAALPLVSAAMIFGIGLLWLTGLASGVNEERRTSHANLLRDQLQSYISNVDVVASYQWSASFKANIDQLGAKIWKLDRKRVRPVALAAGLLSFGSAALAVLGASIVARNINEVIPATLAVAVLMPLAVFDVMSQLQQAAQSYRGYVASRQRLDVVLQSEISNELLVPGGSLELERVERVTARRLNVDRFGTQVLGELDFQLNSGTLTAVTGKSGSGKTSLALVLSSLISPSSGELLINEVPASQYTLQSRRRQILLIEQDPHVFRGTLQQNLEISGQSDAAMFLAALERVGLSEEFSQRGLLAAELSEDASNISGGQAQRIAIARGLLAGASVLILDESTSGLDRENSLALFAILRQLAGQGICVLVITHDPELADLCDDRISLPDRLAN